MKIISLVSLVVYTERINAFHEDIVEEENLLRQK